jgi:hypothetical protein
LITQIPVVFLTEVRTNVIPTYDKSGASTLLLLQSSQLCGDQYLPYHRAISPRHAHSAERSLGQRTLFRYSESLPPSAQSISLQLLTYFLRMFGVVQAKFKVENKNPSGGLYFDCRSCPLKGDVRLLIFHKSTVLLLPSSHQALGLSWVVHDASRSSLWWRSDNFATVVQHHVRHTNTTHLSQA